MIYKIRVILDTKENIFRDIEIKDKHTLWNLHLGIKSAFSLQGDELSNYSILEDDGTVVRHIPLEDMSDDGEGEIMSDVYLNEAFSKVGDKGHFQYGLFDLWEFYCELVEIVEEKPAVNYPMTVFRFGNVPLKAPGKGGIVRKSVIPSMDDEEEDNFGFDDDLDSADFSDEDDERFEDDDSLDFEDQPYNEDED